MTVNRAKEAGVGKVLLRFGVVVAWSIGLAAALASPAGANPAGTIHYPDLSNIIPTNQMSIVVTPTGREFRYTHQIFNGGAGPLEIQPAYNPSAGNYQGTQRVYTHDAAGNWSIALSRPVAGAFVFHAITGTFIFRLQRSGSTPWPPTEVSAHPSRSARRTASASRTPSCSTRRCRTPAPSGAGARAPTRCRSEACPLVPSTSTTTATPASPFPSTAFRTEPIGSERSSTPSTTSWRATRPTTRPTSRSRSRTTP